MVYIRRSRDTRIANKDFSRRGKRVPKKGYAEMALLYNKPHQLTMFLGKDLFFQDNKNCTGEGGNLIEKFNIGCSL